MLVMMPDQAILYDGNDRIVTVIVTVTKKDGYDFSLPSDFRVNGHDRNRRMVTIVTVVVTVVVTIVVTVVGAIILTKMF